MNCLHTHTKHKVLNKKIFRPDVENRHGFSFKILSEIKRRAFLAYLNIFDRSIIYPYLQLR